MNKKLMAAVVAIITTITSINMVQANQPAPATVAILDTALDTSLPVFKDKIVQEVCILEWNSCPNGSNFMEGPGASVMSSALISKNGFDHGTKMAHASVLTNPNIKIVFVRIVGATSTGGLDWVIRNKERFNIQAVSMSQGHHVLGAAGTDYCPKTPITEGKIKALADMGVPVFFPTGNTRDYLRIDWPACIPSAIAIGATMPTDTIAIYSNHDPKLTDFFAIGTVRATVPGGKTINVAGTSASTVIAATQWATVKANKPYLTYTEIYNLISKTSKPTFNSKITNGKLIDLQGALNG